MRRQLVHMLKHFVERKIVQPGEGNPVCELGKFLLKSGRPKSLQLGCADNANDVGGVRCQLHDVFDETGCVEALSDERGVFLESAGWTAGVHAGIKNWCLRKQAVSILLDKYSRG